MNQMMSEMVFILFCSERKSGGTGGNELRIQRRTLTPIATHGLFCVLCFGALFDHLLAF